MFPLLKKRVVNLRPLNKLAVIVNVKFLIPNSIKSINFRTKCIWVKMCLNSLEQKGCGTC